MVVKSDKSNRTFLILSIIIPALLTLVLISAIYFLFFIPSLEQNLLQSRRELTRELGRTAWQLMNDYNDRYLTGELTLEDAQQRASARLEAMRYGDEGKDYFWINGYDGLLVMHPYTKSLVGTNVLDFRDPGGTPLFYNMVKIVNAQGEGFVDYLWQWKDDSTRIVPKISFVKGFEPWQWIVGTGMYTEDIKNRIQVTTLKMIQVLVISLLFMFLFAVIIISTGIKLDRQRIESRAALRASEAKYRRLFETMIDAVYTRSLDGIIIDCNPAFCHLMGADMETIINHPITHFYADPSEYKLFTTEVEGNSEAINYPLKIVRNNGEIRHTLVTAILRNTNPPTIQGVLRDVTEVRLLEEQLNQSQKMEAIGRLAGGVAHDFNNLLTVIIGQTEMALLDGKENTPNGEYLDEVLKSAYRAGELINQLLAFSRNHAISAVPLQLNHSLRNLDNLLIRSIGETIELKLELDDDLPCILADPPQIDQVILNLAINARDAMPSGGTLTVQTSLIPPSQPEDPDNPELFPLGMVRLDIIDNGVGMDEEVRAHIFEPFFTTKRLGHGSGLGLSTVYGIVKKFSGEIRVISEPGQGCHFVVVFPAVSATEEIVENRKVGTNPLKGTESILIVEDDERVRRIAVRILREYGYTTHVASDGEMALEIAAKLPEAVDLLLTDMIMPKMNGIELIKRLREKWPTLCMLMMSAYAPDLEENSRDKNLKFGFIAKPFGPVTLVRKVRDMLDQSD